MQVAAVTGLGQPGFPSVDMMRLTVSGAIDQSPISCAGTRPPAGRLEAEGVIDAEGPDPPQAETLSANVTASRVGSANEPIRCLVVTWVAVRLNVLPKRPAWAMSASAMMAPDSTEKNMLTRLKGFGVGQRAGCE